MEPDDFRACLISMGYDLVSAPSLRRRSPISASLLHRDHLPHPFHLPMRFISPSRPLGLGRMTPFHTGTVKGSVRSTDLPKDAARIRAPLYVT